MALSDNSKINISIKKLAGKAQTSNNKDLANEGLPTGVTISSNTVFGQSIPVNPSKSSLYTITGGVVEYLRLSASFIAGTDTASGRHAFSLQLPDDYEAQSSNPYKGAYPFLNKQAIYITSGTLQLVPASFSNNYEAAPYHTASNVKTQIPVLDARDWYLDSFNGIFFQQDPPGTGDHSQNPRYVDAFLYIGKFADRVATEGRGDPDAQYLVLSATGSLPNERVFTPGIGLKSTDSGAGQPYTLNIKDSIVATISGSQFTGLVGITGSFGATLDSIFGKGMEVNASKGSTSGPGGNDFIYFGSPVGKEIIAAHASSNQVLILSGGTTAQSPNEKNYGDMAFFVSGSIGSRGTNIKGTSIFGGDLVVSGATALNQGAAAGSQVFITTEGKVGIGTSNPAYKLTVGGNMEVGEYIYHRNDSDTFMRFESDQITFSAGSETLLTLKEHSQDTVTVGDGGDVDFQVKTLGDDNTLFVKGDTDAVGIGLSGPATKLHIKDTSPIVRIQRDEQYEDSTLDFAGSGGVRGASIVHAANTNDLVFNVFNGTTVEEILRMGDYFSGNKRQVVFLSGSGIHAAAMKPQNSLDLAFFVSGAIGSRGTGIRGTAAFGGDIFTSGSFYAEKGLSGSLTKLTDGSSYLVGSSGINISSASNGSITISLGSSERLKSDRHLTGGIASGQDVDVSSDFNSAGFRFNKIDVFINGQLMSSGSNRDYLLNTSKTGSIHFNFDLITDDTVTTIVNR